MNWQLFNTLVLISIPVVLFGLLVRQQPRQLGFIGRLRGAFEDLVQDTTAWGAGFFLLAVLMIINVFLV